MSASPGAPGCQRVEPSACVGSSARRSDDFPLAATRTRAAHFRRRAIALCGDQRMRRSPSAGPVPAAERAWHRRWRSYSSTWSPTGSSCTAAVTGPRPVPWSRPTNGTTASTWPPSETLIGLPSLGCPSNMVVATPIASVGDRHTEAVAHLRGVLHTVVDNRSGTDAVDRIGWRAGAVLYLLLRDHPINRWGRCRSCRYTGTIIGSDVDAAGSISLPITGCSVNPMKYSCYHILPIGCNWPADADT
jgi:hypothetical protein